MQIVKRKYRHEKSKFKKNAHKNIRSETNRAKHRQAQFTINSGGEKKTINLYARIQNTQNIVNKKSKLKKKLHKSAKIETRKTKNRRANSSQKSTPCVRRS